MAMVLGALLQLNLHISWYPYRACTFIYSKRYLKGLSVVLGDIGPIKQQEGALIRLSAVTLPVPAERVVLSYIEPLPRCSSPLDYCRVQRNICTITLIVANSTQNVAFNGTFHLVPLIVASFPP